MELQIIQSKIHTLRGERVMLDFDLAELYEVETRRLKEAVRRNIERFPAEFMFELTTAEFKNLRSQIATSSWGGTRYPPFAFTERIVNTTSTDRLPQPFYINTFSFWLNFALQMSHKGNTNEPHFI